jgi:hypothetical protein
LRKNSDFGVLDCGRALAYNARVTAVPEAKQPAPASRWETFLWPRWLPVRARRPLIAQITGAVAVTALVVGPWWAATPDIVQPTTAAAAPVVPLAAPVTPLSSVPKPLPAARPAHLNLDVRHSFASVDLSVTVDGKPALQTRLEGSGKRFGVFGKRSERGYTRTLDLTPGAHLVRVRVLSASEKFDQTRVERFDLGSASVATMRISADKSGLSLVAERPPAPLPEPAAAAENVTAPPATALAPVAAPIQANTAVLQASQAASRQDVNALADLLQSMRSMLIWIAGFVASTSTAFVFEEWLRTRKEKIFRSREAARVSPGRRRRIQDAIDLP